MKILAFTDIHANVKLLEKIVKKSARVDLLVCCGDFTFFGDGATLFFSILKKANKPLFLIPGNHEDMLAFNSLTQRFPFVTNLHRRSSLFQNHLFVGYGGGGFSSIDSGLETFVSSFVKKRASQQHPLIFITHAPPFKSKLDYLPHLHDHRGCKSTVRAIKELRPILTLCGHFHETFHLHDHIGKTLVINPGPDGEILDTNHLI